MFSVAGRRRLHDGSQPTADPRSAARLRRGGADNEGRFRSGTNGRVGTSDVRDCGPIKSRLRVKKQGQKTIRTVTDITKKKKKKCAWVKGKNNDQ